MIYVVVALSALAVWCLAPWGALATAWSTDRDNRRKVKEARRQEAMARARLQEIVDQTRNSYETRRYRERRAAAMKGLGIKRVRQHG